MLKNNPLRINLIKLITAKNLYFQASSNLKNFITVHHFLFLYKKRQAYNRKDTKQKTTTIYSIVTSSKKTLILLALYFLWRKYNFFISLLDKGFFLWPKWNSS